MTVNAARKLCGPSAWFSKSMNGSCLSKSATLESSEVLPANEKSRLLHSLLGKDLMLLFFGEVLSRDFDDWSMGYIPDTYLTSRLNLKYSSSSAFKPFNMNVLYIHYNNNVTCISTLH